jgi:predicted nucleic acid-binding protein
VNGKQLVIDSSVALKWILRDEEALAEADLLLQDLLTGKLTFSVPTLFDYEITNVLKVAVARDRISELNAQLALEKFGLYTIERVNFLPLQDATFKLAVKHNRSAYDSAYVALAQTRGVWFFTGDKRLFNAVNHSLDWVKWIGDYQFDLIP